MTMQDPHAAKLKKRHPRELTKLTKPSLRTLKGVLSVLSVFRGGAFPKKRPFALCVKRMDTTADPAQSR